MSEELWLGEDAWDLGLQVQSTAEKVRDQGITVVIMDEYDTPAAALVPMDALRLWMEHLKTQG